MGTFAPPPSGSWRTFTIGTRVVVRRRRDDHPAPGEPPLTDVRGHVTAVTADGLRLDTGTHEVWIPATDVVASRPIPPAPPRRRPRPVS